MVAESLASGEPIRLNQAFNYFLPTAIEIQKSSKKISNTLTDSKSDLKVELEVFFWSLHN